MHCIYSIKNIIIDICSIKPNIDEYFKYILDSVSRITDKMLIIIKEE